MSAALRPRKRPVEILRVGDYVKEERWGWCRVASCHVADPLLFPPDSWLLTLVGAPAPGELAVPVVGQVLHPVGRKLLCLRAAQWLAWCARKAAQAQGGGGE